MSIKKRYHSDYKVFISLGGDSNRIPFRIPSPTLHDWKQEDFSDLKSQTACLPHDLAETVRITKDFINNKTAQTIYKTCMDIANCFQTLLLAAPNVNKILKNSRNLIVSTIGQVRSHLGQWLTIKNIAGLFSISEHQYYRWKNEKICPESIFEQCLRIYPAQLLKSEIEKIKELLQNPETKFWPLISIHWNALRENLLSCSYSTLLKYSKKLGLFRIRIKKRPKNHIVGYRASYTFEVLHADVTYYTTLDGIRTYLYFISDNFSRKILAAYASLTLSAETCFQNLMNAWNQFSYLKQPSTKVQFWTDGGPENKIECFQGWSEILNDRVKHEIALDTIQFSNSMAESINRTMKYHSLLHDKFENHESVVKHLPTAVLINNSKRPHGQLKGLTPDEAFEGRSFDRLKIAENIAKAQRIRIEHNQKAPCSVCKD